MVFLGRMYILMTLINMSPLLSYLNVDNVLPYCSADVLMCGVRVGATETIFLPPNMPR